MEREPRFDPTQLTSIHLNLEDQAIEFEDRHGTVGRLRFGAETVLYEGRPLLLLPSGMATPPLTPPAAAVSEAPDSAPILPAIPPPPEPPPHQ